MNAPRGSHVRAVLSFAIYTTQAADDWDRHLAEVRLGKTRTGMAPLETRGSDIAAVDGISPPP